MTRTNLKDPEYQQVKSCEDCPFVDIRGVLPRCEKMPNEKDKNNIPVFDVNSVWPRAPIPEWCPLRKRSVLVYLAKG